MGSWLVYKPSFNPIDQVAVEIQPVFESGRGRRLVGVAKGLHRVIGVMLGLPYRLSYLKDTACFMKGGGARGLVGVAKLHPNFN